MSANVDVNANVVDTTAKKTEEKSTIFREYENKKVVAKRILKELNDRFITVKENGRTRQGFRLDDSSDQIGLLSQCHSLQTLVSLAQDFGLSFTKADIIPGQKGTIRKMMDIVIEDILETVCIIPDEDKDKGDHRFDNAIGYVFDASPYNSSCFSEEYSNVDSITWVITSFLLILKHHAEKLHEVCKWEKALIDVIRHGLQYLNDAFINDEDSNDSSFLQTGWNFTKECIEPSLYFSYTVCECYLDIYETFKCFLDYLHAARNKKDYYVAIDPKAEALYEKKKKEYNTNRNRKVDERKREARYDEYNELARIYRLINNINDYDELTIDNTLYGDLEAKCKLVADRVWKLTKARLADQFFYNNLQDTVTEDDIRKSTTSDVLFNTAYIINILLCAGMDEVLDLQRQKHEHLGEESLARKKQQEYDNLLESCLLAVQKAFRTYENLKNSGKDYIVDQFLIGFNEKFDDHKVSISELRKLRMRTFSLLPVLIHTNNKACEYLVKYPHYNMDKYHQNILDNRLVKNGEALWIWERDGFFSGSNYYYVLALKGFYDYHETYEQRYIRIGRNNGARAEAIREKHLTNLRKEDGEIGQLEAKNKQQSETIKEQEAQIARLEEENKNIQRPVEDAVRKVVGDVLEEEFASLFAKVLNHTADVLTLDAANDAKDDAEGTYGNLNDALYNLLVTAMLHRFCEGTKGAITTPDAYAELKDKVDQDFAASILAYVTNINNLASETSKSALLKLLQP